MEEPVLLYCADHQICMISGELHPRIPGWTICPGNSLDPASAQACAELLPGYPQQVLVLVLVVLMLVLVLVLMLVQQLLEVPYWCW